LNAVALRRFFKFDKLAPKIFALLVAHAWIGNVAPKIFVALRTWCLVHA
jgi:hypothetical protein